MHSIDKRLRPANPEMRDGYSVIFYGFDENIARQVGRDIIIARKRAATHRRWEFWMEPYDALRNDVNWMTRESQIA